MISCKALLGMTVIEIGHGIGCGHIMQVVVEEGKKLSFIIKLSNVEESMALIPAEAISGIGSYAAMISSRELLQPVSDEMIESMVHTYGAIVDEQVVTIDGNRIGIVTDYFVDQKQEIGYLLVDTEDKGQLEIQKDQIQVVGKEYIIVNAETVKTSAVVPQSHAFMPNFSGQKPVEKTPVAMTQPMPPIQAVQPVQPVVEQPTFTPHVDTFNTFASDPEEISFEMFQQQAIDANTFESGLNNQMPNFSEGAKAAPIVPVPTRPVKIEPKAHDTGNTFLNEQKNLLAGKRLERDFTDNKGRIILGRGEIITEDLIDDLRKIDRRLVVRLAGCTAHAAR